jgi:NADH:ubiquinone oxidoreductase subunit 4 (subunit M)
MGFVVLGLFSFTELGMQGALYQMLNHGVSTGPRCFLFVGFIYERRPYAPDQRSLAGLRNRCRGSRRCL